MNKAGRAAWRSLGTDRLWTSAPNEKGHRLFSAYPSSLIGEASPRRSALALLWMTIHSAPLCRQPPTPPTDFAGSPDARASGKYFPLIHISLEIEISSGNESFGDAAFDYTGRFDWVIPARADGPGDVIIIIMGFDLTFRTLLYSSSHRGWLTALC